VISLLSAALWLGCPRSPAPVAAGDDLDLSDAPAAPTEPSAVLRAARTAESADLRARAWSVPVTDAPADELAEGLADPSPWVQLAVVRSLAANGGAAPLRRVAVDPAADPYVRAEAAIALGAPEGAAALGRAWVDAAPDARLPLLHAATRLGDAEAKTALATHLAAGELPLEPAFFLSLSDAPDAALAAALAAAQGRVEEELARTVAAARLRLGDDGGAEVLRQALADPEEELRLEVLDLLAEVPGPAADALLERARRDASPFVSTYADLLAQSRTGRDAPAFGKAFESDDWELRQLAVRFAARTAPERPTRGVERLVRDGLADRSPAVRAEAAAAAGALDLRALAPQLWALLGDGSPDVAVAAATALRGW
jgi:hypothetical protein